VIIIALEVSDDGQFCPWSQGRVAETDTDLYS